MLILRKYILASGNTFWASNSSTWRSLVVLAPLSARITCFGVVRGVSSEAANIFFEVSWFSPRKGMTFHGWPVYFYFVLHSKVCCLHGLLLLIFWFEWGYLPFILVLMNGTGGSQIGRGSLGTSSSSSQGLSLLGHPRVWWWQDCTLWGWTWVSRWWEWLCYGRIQMCLVRRLEFYPFSHW